MDKPINHMIAQSPTSLNTFITCPRQYEAKYITKEVEFVQNDNARFGELFHKAIENYLAYGTALPKRLKPLERFLSKARGKLIGAEVKLAIDKNNNLVDFFSPEAYQRCIVDAIIGDEKGTIICIDWKTGKRRDAQTQHDFIKKCVSIKYPEAKIITYFIYVFVGQSDRQEYTHGAPLAALDHKMRLLAEAYARQRFDPIQNGLCKRYCDVISCPFNGKNAV